MGGSPTSAVDVTTWWLEQTDPGALVAPRRDPLDAVDVVRAEVASPSFSRFLYTAVGGDWHWTDRLGWSEQDWLALLERPGVETWTAWVRGTPAGYVELVPDGAGSVEIAYFGLLPAFIGRGLGGHLLWRGTAAAWSLADRHPSVAPTRRVWVHTCSLDGPAARRNYEARGFRVVREATERLTIAARPPGPWPGARAEPGGIRAAEPGG